LQPSQALVTMDVGDRFTELGQISASHAVLALVHLDRIRSATSSQCKVRRLNLVRPRLLLLFRGRICYYLLLLLLLLRAWDRENAQDHSDVILSYPNVTLTTNTPAELNVMASQRITYNKDVETFANRHKRRTENLLTTDFPRKVRLFDDLDRTVHDDEAEQSPGRYESGKRSPS